MSSIARKARNKLSIDQFIFLIYIIYSWYAETILLKKTFFDVLRTFKETRKQHQIFIITIFILQNETRREKDEI